MKLRRLLATTAAVLALAGSARAQGIPGQAMVPLGHCQLSAIQLSSAVGLSTCSGGVPAGTTMVTLQAETANVRYLDDGTAPTAGLGNLVISGQLPFLYTGTVANLKFIAATGAPILDVIFYRQ